MKKKQPLSATPKPSLKRENKANFTLNDKEFAMMKQYLEKHKISNQSRWIREVVMSYLWNKAEEDYPTLFNENEIRK